MSRDFPLQLVQMSRDLPLLTRMSRDLPLLFSIVLQNRNKIQ